MSESLKKLDIIVIVFEYSIDGHEPEIGTTHVYGREERTTEELMEWCAQSVMCDGTEVNEIINILK